MMMILTLEHVTCANLFECDKAASAAAKVCAVCTRCGRSSDLNWFHAVYPLTDGKTVHAFLAYFCNNNTECGTRASEVLRDVHKTVFGHDSTKREHFACLQCRKLFHPRHEDYCARCHLVAWCSPACVEQGRKMHEPYCIPGPPLNPLVKQCVECKKVLEKHLYCSRCRGVYYCSSECQKSHWSSHKANCKPVPVLSEKMKQ